jgi:hypothetical protein
VRPTARRLGDQRVVPGFRWLFLLCMSSSRIPGPRRLHLPSSSSTAAALTQRRWVRRFVLTPNIPSNPFHEGALNFGTACFAFATTCKVACLPLTDPTPLRAPTETFTPGLSTGRSPFPSPGMTTVVAGRLHRQDLHLLEHQLASLQLLFQAFPNAMRCLFARSHTPVDSTGQFALLGFFAN